MTLRVLTPGPLTTVQDHGRRGRAHEGVARAGVFDRRAADLANRLVGNERSAAVLEVLLGPFEAEAVRPCVVAVTGAEVLLAAATRPTGCNMAVWLDKGQTLTLGTASSGMRAYVAVRGGIDVEPVLGSRSFDSLGRIGPPPLRAGDVLHAGAAAPAPAWFEPVPIAGDRRGAALGHAPALTVRLGPRDDWLEGEALARFLHAGWTVGTQTDRTGVRLTGPALARRTGELASEAMVPGAIQLPADGQPIVLGPDCGVTGGYPVIGVVDQRALDHLAQARPGDRVRFVRA